MNRFSEYAGISLVVFSMMISLGLGEWGFGIRVIQINPKDILERQIKELYRGYSFKPFISFDTFYNVRDSVTYVFLVFLHIIQGT